MSFYSSIYAAHDDYIYQNCIQCHLVDKKHTIAKCNYTVCIWCIATIFPVGKYYNTKGVANSFEDNQSRMFITDTCIFCHKTTMCITDFNFCNSCVTKNKQ